MAGTDPDEMGIGPVYAVPKLLEQHGFGSQDVDHEIDATAADELDARHLEVAEGSPVLRLHRVSRDADGRPFEASEDRYRSDIVRFTVSASGRWDSISADDRAGRRRWRRWPRP